MSGKLIVPLVADNTGAVSRQQIDRMSRVWLLRVLIQVSFQLCWQSGSQCVRPCFQAEQVAASIADGQGGCNGIRGSLAGWVCVDGWYR